MRDFLFTAIVTFFLLGCELNAPSYETNSSFSEPRLVTETITLQTEESVLIGQKAVLDLEQKTVILGGKIYSVEVADTAKKRRQGLMNRDFLAADEGMLFPFGGMGIYPFWMKNTLIPLTMIWIDDGGVVVDVQEAIPCVEDPCTHYVPKEKAMYVLEIASK